MRVVAGKYKRSTLLTLDSLATRPTKDMVKEALFSSIYVEDSLFLDLFSGSGSIGIEALSRGARDVVFNDLSKDAVKIIKTNLSKFKEDDAVTYHNWKKTPNDSHFFNINRQNKVSCRIWEVHIFMNRLTITPSK